MHMTFSDFVALKELPQQGQMYFLVLLGFLVLGTAVPLPLPDLPPLTPISAYPVVLPI